MKSEVQRILPTSMMTHGARLAPKHKPSLFLEVPKSKRARKTKSLVENFQPREEDFEIAVHRKIISKLKVIHKRMVDKHDRNGERFFSQIIRGRRKTIQRLKQARVTRQKIARLPSVNGGRK